MSLRKLTLEVEDFVWYQDRPFDVASVDSLKEAEAVLPSLSGQFALHLTDGFQHLLARDPLGVNKLFFAQRDGRAMASNYLFELLARGFRWPEISSVPSGHAVFLDTHTGAARLSKYYSLPLNHHGGRIEGGLEACAERIREALHATFCRIRQAVSGRRVYVTMSGGLDSTVVAVLARDHLTSVQGVTFQVQQEGPDAEESEDVRFARRVAQDLGIPLAVITVTPEEILGELEAVLKWGQDWRDFNVHCGLVNGALGRALAHMPAAQNGRPVLLTGDTMNEMMADYTPVWYGDQELYRLPRLSPGQLRRFLVAGLDSGDREVGILAKLGFSVIQPYAMCADAYLSVPAEFLESAFAKQRLARLVMGDRIPEYVAQRGKVRAQAASSTEVGGTLAVLLNAGVDQRDLRRQWCELYKVPLTVPDELIRAGVYKCSV
jgi:asparagine synthase (glutamine-hydrolysing)